MTDRSTPPIAHVINSDAIQTSCSNLIELLEQRSSEDKIAITFLDGDNEAIDKTGADLLEGARRVATYLRNRGLRKGEKVVVLLVNNNPFVDSFFGTMLAGGIPIPASPPLNLGDLDRYLTNLRHIIDNSGARFIITFAAVEMVIKGALSGCKSLEEVIRATEIGNERAQNPIWPTIDADDTAFLQYTSGTTKLPRGVELTHRALLANIFGIMKGIATDEHDRAVCWLPMFHDMGLIGGMLVALYSRGHQYSMKPETFLKDPTSWLRTVSRYKAHITLAPNFAYHRCCTHFRDQDLDGLDLSHLRTCLNGAEPVDARTLEKFEERFSKVGYRSTVTLPVYGMAENCLAATFPALGKRYHVESIDRAELEPEAVTAASGDESRFFDAVSVGKPLAGQQIAIKGKNGRFAREMEAGEVLVKSPSLMKGYYRNDEETAKVLKDGWLHTGDRGYIKDGLLIISGREKEMIVKRGRNYFPFDIESAISDVAGVRKGGLAAFGVTAPHKGTEDLVLVVETQETGESRKELMAREIATEVLNASGIRPDKILLVPPHTIPKTTSGKVQRLLCRQRYIDGILPGMKPDDSSNSREGVT